MLITLLFLAVTAPFVLLAQSPNETTLPPKAQAAVEKGLSAAKEAQWTVAIGCFNEARQAAPDSPVPLVNLGLAEAQLSGHELRAICWFEAYLALVPTAVNAPAVRKQISDLEIRIKGNVNKIIEMLKVLATQLPSTDIYLANRHALAAIAGLLTSSGDLDAAEQIVQNQSDKDIQNCVREQIVEALAKGNRIPDAIKEADQITDNSLEKGKAYEVINSAQIAAGLFSDASRSIDQTYADDRLRQRLALIEAEYQSGKRDDAIALLSDVRASIEKEGNKEAKYTRNLVDFAVLKYKIGQHDDADAIFQQIKRDAYNTEGKTRYVDRMDALMDLARGENELGRRSVAISTMKEAEAACRAARSSGEKATGIMDDPEHHVLEGYYSVRDWDRANLWIHRYLSRKGKFYFNFGGHEDLELRMVKEKLEAEDAVVALNSTRVTSIRVLTDSSALPARRAQIWCDYVTKWLSAPLFTTDFKVTLAGLGRFTPETYEGGKSESIFDHVKQPAEDFMARLNDIHDMRKAAASATTNSSLIDHEASTPNM